MQKTCIIVPCFNESERLNSSAFFKFINDNRIFFDLLFVNDGSTDNTNAVLTALVLKQPENIGLLYLEKNSGKAEAIRQGALKALEQKKYKAIIYFDADLATPLNELNLLYNLFEKNNGLKIILCSRMKRLGSNVQRSVKRHFFGRVFSTFASLILKMPVYDSQCGAKLVCIDEVEYLFKDVFITKWLFDVELLARLRNKYPESVLKLAYEHPISEWKDVSGSKLKLKHMFKVPFELIKIKRKYNKQ